MKKATNKETLLREAVLKKSNKTLSGFFRKQGERDIYEQIINKVPCKIVNGEQVYDENAVDITDWANFNKFNDYAKEENTLNFTKDQIDDLLSTMPFYFKNFGSTFKNNQMRHNTGEIVGDLPSNKYRYTKNSDGKTIAECIDLAETLLDKARGLPDKDITAITIRSLLGSLVYLKTEQEHLAFEGYEIPYDGTRGLEEKEMKHYEKTFNRRNELPKDSFYRHKFVNAYIDEEVYSRFYIDEEKKAGRYGTDKEFKEAYTPERAKEYDDHFNALCDEYKEQAYKRNYTNEDYKARPCNKLSGYSYHTDQDIEHKEIKELARHYGIDPAIMERGDTLDKDYMTEIRKRVETNKTKAEGDTPTSKLM